MHQCIVLRRYWVHIPNKDIFSQNKMAKYGDVWPQTDIAAYIRGRKRKKFVSASTEPDEQVELAEPTKPVAQTELKGQVYSQSDIKWVFFRFHPLLFRLIRFLSIVRVIVFDVHRVQLSHIIFLVSFLSLSSIRCCKKITYLVWCASPYSLLKFIIISSKSSVSRHCPLSEPILVIRELFI